MAEQRPLDELIPRELSKDAKLLNLNAANIVKLFGRTATYIPVAISDSPAGRETVYKLPIGEKTLMGVYVAGTRIYNDYFTRLSEYEYSCSKETLDGKVLFSGKGTLKVLDERVGAGEIVFESEEPTEDEPAEGQPLAARRARPKCTCTRRWYVWSFIATEDCDCIGGRPPILTT
jgi:hypothetical protein